MRNKKIIIFIIVVILALTIGVVYIFNNVQSSLQCAKEGETIGASGMPSSCCSSLKAVGGWPGGYSGDCTLPPPPTGLGICVQCGDGKCDINNGENKCNCKEDCK